MLQKVVTGLILCGVIVVVLASLQPGQPEPWFHVAALLFSLGLAIIVAVFLLNLARRFVRHLRRRAGPDYRDAIKRSRPLQKFEKFTQKSSRRTRPLWQSEATYEQEQAEGLNWDTLQYAPRSSARMATVRVREHSPPPGNSAPSPATAATPHTAVPGSFGPESPPRAPAPPQIHWVSPAQTLEIAGLPIEGGMFYVAHGTALAETRVDPGWIDVSLAVDLQGDYRRPLTSDFRNGYSGLSPQERGAYLQWLGSGRSAADAHIGYVFLFFYGLERRVLIDAQQDAGVQTEFPVLAAELDRLLSLHGANPSFGGHANQLLGVITALSQDDDHYLRPLPALARESELPLYLKIVLGQSAIHAHPLSAETALAWVRHSPDIVLRPPALQCPALFEAAFRHRYQDSLGEGLNLPLDPTTLKHDYRAASAALSSLDIRLDFGDLPDVSASGAPIRQLARIVEQATDDITDYSRYIEKNPEEAGEVDALLMLPVRLWPNPARLRLTHLKNRLRGDMRVTSLPELWRELGLQSALTRPKLLEVLSVLADHRVSMVPDVLGGASMPKQDEPVVLLVAESPDARKAESPSFQAALVALQLAESVANADGDFCLKELEQIRKRLAAWPQLSENEHRRLLAHVRLMRHTPNSLGGVGQRIKALDSHAKEAVARFIVAVAGADGQVTPEELHVLQLAYRAMGLDTNRAQEDAHREQVLRQRTGNFRAGTGGERVDTASAAGGKGPMQPRFVGTVVHTGADETFHDPPAHH